MKKTIFFALALPGYFFLTSCQDSSKPETSEPTTETATNNLNGQSAVSDDQSQKNIVQVAMGSKDHTTLVAAVKQAELVDALSNAGPFTVFAPTDAAFNQLPKGTVDDLMKSENKDKLIDILQYHVSVGVLKDNLLQDGQSIGQVNGGNIKITKKGDEIYINNEAKIVGTVPAANGLIYVVDKVLLPQ